MTWVGASNRMRVVETAAEDHHARRHQGQWHLYHSDMRPAEQWSRSSGHYRAVHRPLNVICASHSAQDNKSPLAANSTLLCTRTTQHGRRGSASLSNLEIGLIPSGIAVRIALSILAASGGEVGIRWKLRAMHG
jgi:hypothetical protein